MLHITFVTFRFCAYLLCFSREIFIESVTAFLNMVTCAQNPNTKMYLKFDVMSALKRGLYEIDIMYVTPTSSQKSKIIAR